jgi:hypothetical protein
MYYLSVSGPNVDQWLSRSKLPIKERRVYRWNNIWGYLVDDTFQAYKRSFVAESTDGDSRFNLEKQEVDITPAPPLLCDDIWDEEYMEHTRGTCNGVLTIIGTMKDIQMWCKTAHIPVPESLWMGVPEITSSGSNTLLKQHQQPEKLQSRHVRHSHQGPRKPYSNGSQRNPSHFRQGEGTFQARPHATNSRPYNSNGVEHG